VTYTSCDAMGQYYIDGVPYDCACSKGQPLRKIRSSVRQELVYKTSLLTKSEINIKFLMKKIIALTTAGDDLLDMVLAMPLPSRKEQKHRSDSIKNWRKAIGGE